MSQIIKLWLAVITRQHVFPILIPVGCPPSALWPLRAVTFLVFTFCAAACNRGTPQRSIERSTTGPPVVAESGYDVQFLDTMTKHHEKAFEMWQIAVTRAAHDELKNFANEAADEQQKEIMLMRNWRDKWYANAPISLGTQSAAAADITMDMSLWRERHAGDFDLAFLAMMIPHHQRAADMAKEAVWRADLPEIRQLAQIIVNQQEAEVEQMTRWSRAWSEAR